MRSKLTMRFPIFTKFMGPSSQCHRVVVLTPPPVRSTLVLAGPSVAEAITTGNGSVYPMQKLLTVA